MPSSPPSSPFASSPLILVVEDEPAIGELVRGYLVREGWTALVVRDGETALAAIARDRPALVLLDVGLPGLDGIEVCRRLRAAGNWVPVLFVTARDEEADRVLGLELGADDYVTKPFSPRELVARVRAVLRRREPAGPGGPPAGGTFAGAQLAGGTLAGGWQAGGSPLIGPLRVGTVVLDLEQRRANAGGEPVELTTTEFDLLAHLMRRPGRVFPREELLADVWGYPAGTATRTVDVHIAQLRAKLGERLSVRSVRGVGYAVEP